MIGLRRKRNRAPKDFVLKTKLDVKRRTERIARMDIVIFIKVMIRQPDKGRLIQ